MRNDSDIQRDSDAELRDRGAEARHVAATVHSGVVRLTGFTDSYCEKYSVEKAIRAIAGVVDVADEIEVHIAPLTHPADAELRCEVVRALQTEVPTVFDRLTIRVRGGEVTLEGVVSCRFMRERAESAVRRLGNIATVHNAITLEAEALSREVQERIGNANVSACASCGEVTLSGDVSSEAARIRAEQAAWSVPGVLRVKNDIRSSAQSSANSADAGTS